MHYIPVIAVYSELHPVKARPGKLNSQWNPPRSSISSAPTGGRGRWDREIEHTPAAHEI